MTDGRKNKNKRRRRAYESTTAPPTPKRRKAVKTTESASILSLPPEILEKILSWLSVSDVVSFGATCRRFHQVSHSRLLWKNVCCCQGEGALPVEDTASTATDWRREAILRHSQALFIHPLGRGRHGGYNKRSTQPSLTQAINPPLAFGFRRVLPTKDHLLLLDHQDTLFVLSNGVVSSLSGELTPARASQYVVLSHHVKDFATDPRTDLSCRQYVYLLTRQAYSESGLGSSSGTSPTGPMVNWIEVYDQRNWQRIFCMAFDPSLTFTQMRLFGNQVKRNLLLLSDTGKAYGVTLFESQLTDPFYEMDDLSMKNICSLLPDLRIKEFHTSGSSVLYLTDEGSVYLEAFTAGVNRLLFGGQRDFYPRRAEIPLPLRLPHKVVKCALGPSHLCLVDEEGRLFVQGSNRYGQLGTGDKMDRGEPTEVALSMAVVDVWCGLNHTLALLQGESGNRQVHGCGCGAAGRLPGWPRGSPVFVQLAVEVPRTAHSLCSFKDSLYLLCCHDTADPPVVSPPHASSSGVRGGKEDEEERGQLQILLARLRGCESVQGQLEILMHTLQTSMTLNSIHYDFLYKALALVQSNASTTNMDHG